MENSLRVTNLYPQHGYPSPTAQQSVMCLLLNLSFTGKAFFHFLEWVVQAFILLSGSPQQPHVQHRTSHSWGRPEEFFSSSSSPSKRVCASWETLHLIEISLSVDFYPQVCVLSSQRATQPSRPHGSPPNTARQQAHPLEFFPCKTLPCALGREQLT